MLEIYQQVSLRGEKTGKCLCGKRLKRSKTFTQTINPYNKNEDGDIKSHEEILIELRDSVEKWKKEKLHCSIRTYWTWSDKERKEYEEKGSVEIEAPCGSKILVKKLC